MRYKFGEPKALANLRKNRPRSLPVSMIDSLLGAERQVPFLRFGAKRIASPPAFWAGTVVALCLWLLFLPILELHAQSNSAPTITSSSRTTNVKVGVPASFTATATDTDGNITQWRWFLDGVEQRSYTFLPQSSATRVIPHTFNTKGTYTIKSEFLDDGGLSASISWSVEVTAPPSVSRVSPPSSEVDLEPGDSETFSARATDADNNINKWEWFVDNVSQGGQSLTPTGDITREFSYTFATADTYTVEVEFTDSEGDSDSVSWTVTANRSPSVSRVSPSSSSINVSVGESQTFSAKATDADNNISEWEWFVDDVSQGGQSLSLTGDITRQFSHTFSSTGTYTVKVEFTDELLDSDSVSWTVDADAPSVDVRFGHIYWIVLENVGSYDIPVTISASPGEDVTVNVQFDHEDDTATIQNDFRASSTSVTFQADTTTLTQNIPVTIVDSVDVELAETFFVELQKTSSTPSFVTIPEFGAASRGKDRGRRHRKRGIRR